MLDVEEATNIIIVVVNNIVKIRTRDDTSDGVVQAQSVSIFVEEGYLVVGGG